MKFLKRGKKPPVGADEEAGSPPARRGRILYQFLLVTLAVPVLGGDEVGAMAGEFNTMLGELKESFIEVTT